MRLRFTALSIIRNTAEYADIAVKNKAEIFCCHAYIAQAMYIGKLRTADLTE